MTTRSRILGASALIMLASATELMLFDPSPFIKIVSAYAALISVTILSVTAIFDLLKIRL